MTTQTAIQTAIQTAVSKPKFVKPPSFYQDCGKKAHASEYSMDRMGKDAWFSEAFKYIVQEPAELKHYCYQQFCKGFGSNPISVPDHSKLLGKGKR